MADASSRTLLKLVVLGNAGAGKTSILDRFVNGTFNESYKTTIGVDFLTKDVQVDERVITLQIWDTAGQEKYRSLGSNFYRGADGCILVYDMCDAQSFSDVENWMTDFVHQGCVRDEEVFPFLLVGNKLDAPPDARQVSLDAATLWCEQHNSLPHVEVSAKENTNIEDAFLLVAGMALEAIASGESLHITYANKPKKPKKVMIETPKKEDGCCS